MTYSLNTLQSGAAAVQQPARARALRFAHEISLIAGFVLLLFWLLAMLSYTPSDAAWSTSGTGGEIKNWGGRLGAWLADGSYYLAGYSVWWAGHTYGPRYLLDVLPLLAPAAAAGVDAIAPGRRPGRVIAAALLAWSVGVAAAGAFVYPNEAWNTRPLEVDRFHERLWAIGDSQIPRALSSPPSPQNFDLFRWD